ncbi:hypothetical protein AAF712_009434 [Marasmius tenuissimus]|uniref:DUF6535 domain-containing protein n=1 Tax=Marasmius tenuissimus TaxID=585030 RepID=A0ABR2ZPN8_9AGAR
MKEAGLFSAVVTAFTIESYQWLEEQPEDTTVTLLKQLSWQQINGTTPPNPEPFQVSTSVVRINVLWFLSLIIALVDALFALLCKQWLREHSRHTHTRTPAEALALRWLRNQSLKKWHVPTILASLPMLLELALFLFLAGLLELLRTRHPVPFAIAMAVVVLTALFYIVTTIIPSVNIIRQALRVTQRLREMRIGEDTCQSPFDFIVSLPPLEYTCPLKSPQAWAAFRCFERIPHIFTPTISMLRSLCRKHNISSRIYHNLSNQLITLQQILSGLSSWSSVDLELLQRLDSTFTPPFYELSAFRWLVAELRDSPIMIPHLQSILSTLPLHLVMPAALDQWFFLPDREWALDDIGAALRLGSNPHGVEGHISPAKQQCLDHIQATDKFNQFLHWVHVSMNIDHAPDHIQHPPRPQILLASFSSIDGNLDDDQLFSCLWEPYKQMAEDPAVQPSYLVGLMQDLAPHIIACSPDYALEVSTATTTSPFVESDAGCEFLRKVHDRILNTRAYRGINSTIAEDWMEAMDIVCRVHRLSEDHFKPIPSYFLLRLSKLKETLSRLSPTNPGTYFGYLDSFRTNWGSAYWYQREKLVKILSEHINNYPQSTTNSHTHADSSMVSPLVLSSAGLELITMVNNQLAEDWAMYRYLFPQNRVAWDNAVQQIKTAQPDLLPDNFKDIFHKGLSRASRDSFSLSLFQLQKALSHQIVSAMSPGTDMSSIISIFKDRWDKAHIWDRRRLIELLSTHIIHPQSNPESLIYSDDPPSSVSLISSPAVLELVVFINNKLAEESLTWERLWENNQSAWRDALEHIRNAHGLPINYFKPIVHVTNSQPSPNEAGVSTNQTHNTPKGNRRYWSIQF